MLFMLSGHVSYRDAYHGSLFIRALVKVFAEGACELDVEMLCKIVSLHNINPLVLLHLCHHSKEVDKVNIKRVQLGL